MLTTLRRDGHMKLMHNAISAPVLDQLRSSSCASGHLFDPVTVTHAAADIINQRKLSYSNFLNTKDPFEEMPKGPHSTRKPRASKKKKPTSQ